MPMKARRNNSSTPMEKPLKPLKLARVRTVDFSPRTQNQKDLVRYADKHDVIFATGSAGGGKTYVTVAICALALLNRKCERLIITRPIVEAGEHLGFLPGTLEEKVDPYVAPIMDALRKFLSPEILENYLYTKKIEIIPLAFTRGRTYEDCYIIGDEMQNATANQIKMLLTRLGKNSKIFITGDETQIDLPYQSQSGLSYALAALFDEPDVAHVHFCESDIQRHHMVGKILTAFKKHDTRKFDDILPEPPRPLRMG